MSPKISQLKILVVEDDSLARQVMAERLSKHAVEFAGSVEDARARLEARTPDVCFIDLDLGDGKDSSGLELIPAVVSKGVYAAVMSGRDSDQFVDRAYELGCRDFCAKGDETASVELVLSRFLARRHNPAEDTLFAEQFITDDEETRAAVRAALAYASSELPIMILGPSGVGKTSLARVIHDWSGRPGEFVAINCAAYTEELLEVELFGCKRGAFTGATESRKGKLLLADGGTLFLDEIGSMSLTMQTKLLKAIEERSFYPVGAERPESSSFRIVSATLENLQELMAAGRLRFDFFQRIHGYAVNLKTLAHRKGDILPMIARFARGGKRLSFTPGAKERLLAHNWSGNVRELKRLVDLIVTGEDGRVDEEVLRRVFAAADPLGNGKPGTQPAKARELVSLMTKQVGALAESLASFERTEAA